MPELPELAVVQEVLDRRLGGRQIRRVTVDPKGGPIVVRDLTGGGFAQTLSGKTADRVTRRGKFLILHVHPGDLKLVINPKLSGRLQLCPPEHKKAGPVHVTLTFDDPLEELRYIDRKKMGQLYLTHQLDLVPTFSEMGPEALGLAPDAFRTRLRTFRGEIKGILTRERFLAGIGNAYADEILWQARIHPFRKRPSLKPEEVDRLHAAMHKVLEEATEKVRKATGDDIHLKPRDFMAVHLRAGEPCPRCGTAVSAITANRRITNFCRVCQPGGLITGM